MHLVLLAITGRSMQKHDFHFFFVQCIMKQLLDSVFVIWVIWVTYHLTFRAFELRHINSERLLKLSVLRNQLYSLLSERACFQLVLIA